MSLLLETVARVPSILNYLYTIIDDKSIKRGIVYYMESTIKERSKPWCMHTFDRDIKPMARTIQEQPIWSNEMKKHFPRIIYGATTFFGDLILHNQLKELCCILLINKKL